MPDATFLRVRCPSCGAVSSRVPATLAGRTVRCVRCEARFPVPVADDEPAPTVAEPAPTVAEGESVPPTVAEAGGELPTAAEEGAVLPTVPEAALPRRAGADGDMAWEPGDVVLGLYEVTGVLGQGGMGRVYRVRHRGWSLDLALKAPLPAAVEAAGGPDLFEREAETWVGLGLHAHVVTCHYVRRLGALPLVFAEYVDGGSLHDAIRAGRLDSVESILDVAVQFAWGLRHAHEQGLVHRDVKPANVLLTTDGLAKVTDFGLARARSVRLGAARAGSEGHTLTVEGGGGGTPAYLSPEQAAGDALTRRSDLWSFGLSVLEMFVGGRTWDYGLAAPAVLEAYRREGPLRGRPPMPSSVADWLARCFRERPEDRPHDAAEAAACLEDAWEAATGHPYPRREPKPAEGSADSANNRAVSLVDLGREADASASWRRALKLAPHHVEATYNEALAAWAAARLTDTEALRRMEEACTSHPASGRAQLLLGRLHLLLGRPPEARTAFERATSLGGTHVVEDDRDWARPAPEGATLRGLPGPASALALSPDGSTVAAGSGGSVRVWDAATGQLRRALTVSEESVRSLVFLPEGGGLVVAAENAPLAVWDPDAGRLARSFARHPGSTTCLAVVPGGRLLLAGGSDRVVRLWETATGRCVRESVGHEDAIVAVAAGSSVLASAGRDGTLRLWSLDDGRLLAVLRGLGGRPLALAIHEPSARLVCAGEDGVVRDFGLASHELVRAYVSHGQPVGALALSPDGERVTSGSADSTVRVFDVDGERLVSLTRLDAAVQALATSGDGTTWAAYGTSVTRLALPRLHLPPPALCRPASAVEEARRSSSFDSAIAAARQALDRDDLPEAIERLRSARAVAGRERSEVALALWDELCVRLPRRGLRSAWEEARLGGHGDAVQAIRADTTGTRALSASLDGTVRLWDVAARRCNAVLSGHTGGVMAVSFVGDQGRALSGGRDRTLRLWDLERRVCTAVFEGHDEAVVSVDAAPGGRRVASASWDGTARVWDVPSASVRHVLAGHAAQVAAVRFSAGGEVLGTAGWDGTVRLWDPETGGALGVLEDHEGNVSALALDPAGRQVASGGEDGAVRVFDPRSRRLLRTLPGHEAEVTGLAFTPDGRFLMSSSRDGSVRVWDLRRGQAARSLSHPAAVLDVALARLGVASLAAVADGSVRLWHLDWDPEAAAVARDLTHTTRAASASMAATVRHATLRDDLRHATPTVSRRSLPRAADAARRLPWRLIGLGAAVAVAAVVSVVAWWRPAPRTRLSPSQAPVVASELDLIDLQSFAPGCSAGDYAAHLERLRIGNPSAHDVACVAAEGSPAVVGDVLDAALLTSPEPLTARRLERNAASALAGLAGDAIAALCDRLGDPRPEVRATVALALSGARDPGASGCVRSAILSGTGAARAAAAVALRHRLAHGDIPPVEGRDLVEHLLDDPDPEVRRAGLGVLELFSFATAEPAAQRLVDDPDPDVAAAARAALGVIAGVHRADQLRGDDGP